MNLRLSFSLVFSLCLFANLRADLNAIQGKWRLAEGTAGGNILDDSQLDAISMSIDQGKYDVTIGDIRAKGKISLDDTKSPRTMDIAEVDGPNAGRTIYAIYEPLAGGSFRACYALDGGSRPTEFKSTPDNGWFLAKYAPNGGQTGGSTSLKVLLITGGCCHEYDHQAETLSKGLSARANMALTVVRDPGADGTQHRVSAYQKDDWARGYDLVIHNECYSDEKDPAWLERIVKPHREGVPAVVVHCAMHCYRVPNNEWFKFVGVTSHRHGSHFAYPMTNVKPTHPIMMGFPAAWMTPKEELYNIEKVEPTATALATGFSHETNRGEVNTWINTYGQARVFGTTVGHYNQTMSEPVFLDLMARGALWAAGKLGDDGKPVAGYGPSK